MRTHLHYLAAGLLSLFAAASHAGPPGLSVTSEDLRNLRSTSATSHGQGSSAAQPKNSAQDSEFSRQFQKALGNEEKARQTEREQQVERNRMPHLEQNNRASHRLGPPDNKKENMGIYFDSNGSAATSCREDELGKTRCKVRELR